MRLIDADRLSEAIYDNVPAPYEDASWAKENCLAEIEAAQTVDAVPVVCCRECKKKNKKKCPMTIVNFGRDGKEILVQNHVPDDFYCAAGERKEGAE